ncbi:MAG TPA: hypothetical protein VGO64_01050 [Candidatus Limnocylindrales bacterium]|nr:hypothetical protein [Candidatus Limnocylindrales bacterium]
MPASTHVHVVAPGPWQRITPRPATRLKDVTHMQPLAAYYVVVATETARNAQEHRYQSAPPSHARRTRLAAAVASFLRPARRGLASAV